MTFGLTDSGFNKKTLADILETLNDDVVAAFGAANVAPDSVFGQYNGIMSEALSDLWDLADLVYASQYALSSKGVSLDSVSELNNLTRLAATPSTANAILEGDEFTTVPAGTQFRQTGTDEIFQTTEEIQLLQSNLLKIVISVNDFATQPHSIDITTEAGTDNFVSTVDSSEIDVLNDFKTQINTLGNHAAEVDTDNETLTITNNDLSSIESFGVVVDATLDIDQQWTPAPVEALNTGEIAVPANSLQIIETPVSGLDAVDNMTAGTPGRSTETDDEFRLRRKQSIRVVGAATVPSIESRLVEEIDAVVSATVKDNRTDFPDADGRPPHSFEAIVTFSPDTAAVRQAIADKLWEVGGGGIQTVGTITEQVTDSAGDLQTIKFSQPTNKYIHIRTSITLNPEEVFPSDGLTAIAQALADFGNELNAGEDCIRQRFYNSIYSVSGVENIEVFEFATTENPGDTPTPLATEQITGEPEPGLYDFALATLISSGIVSGMVAVNTADNSVTSIKNVVSETQARLNSDIANVGALIQFGDFGATNIAINANEIARFDTARITVIIV